jgi:hypothetical protein
MTASIMQNPMDDRPNIQCPLRRRPHRSVAPRMGGAKRYPSIFLYESDGFRKGLNPSLLRAIAGPQGSEMTRCAINGRQHHKQFGRSDNEEHRSDGTKPAFELLRIAIALLGGRLRDPRSSPRDHRWRRSRSCGRGAARPQLQCLTMAHLCNCALIPIEPL